MNFKGFQLAKLSSQMEVYMELFQLFVGSFSEKNKGLVLKDVANMIMQIGISEDSLLLDL